MPKDTVPIITYLDPLDDFTDREEILALFEQFLHSAQPGQLRLLTVKGNSGTGKTFLISYLTNQVCPKHNWRTGQMSFFQSRPDFRSILMALEYALKECVPIKTFKRYLIKRDLYNKRFEEYQDSIVVHQNIEASDQSTISDINQIVHINTQLRERELQLRSEQTHALIALSKETRYPLCLFIDGYEQLDEGDPELSGWLWENVLLELAKASSQPLVVMTCGWEHPSNATIKPFSYARKLDDFDLIQTRSYLDKRKVIVDDVESSSTGQEELVNAFYELTKGHPLVLSLAVTYFNQLDSHERTAESLEINKPLIDEQTRIEFLEDRLLKRLSEPYRSLLERGPILRYFDQAVLQSLLSVNAEGNENIDSKLEDRTYDRFLRFPFINQGSQSNIDSRFTKPTFHDLVRRVRLEALRKHHPETKEQLHQKIATYYKEIADRKQQKVTPTASTPDDDYTLWIAMIPEDEFKAMLEWLYHALQVRKLQTDAFDVWLELISEAIYKRRIRQAELLLELILQLSEEGETFLNNTSVPFGRYLIWFSRLLIQMSRRKDAQDALEEAAKIFEQANRPNEITTCFNNIGYIFISQRKLGQALMYFERALSLREKIGDTNAIAISLNNIGYIYYAQGELEKALKYFERILPLKEQVNNRHIIAATLTHIGLINLKRGELELALENFQQSLNISVEMKNAANVAINLESIGQVIEAQGQRKMKEALSYHQRSLEISLQVGDPTRIANCFNNIGYAYQQQGRLREALMYFEQSLALYDQVDNPVIIEFAFNNIGNIYFEQEKLAQALINHEQSLALREQIGNPSDIAQSLHNIGNIYYEKREFSQAIERFSKALNLYKRCGRGYELDVVDELGALASCYTNLGKLEEAKACQEQAHQISMAVKKKSC